MIINFFIRYMTFLGNLFPQFLICALLLFIDFRQGYLVGSIWFWGYALNVLIKNTIRKERPPKAQWKVPHVNGHSFPSGHSLMSIVLYWSIVKYFHLLPPYSYVLYALPFALGLSRLYLRVHFIEDVLGGWLIGFLYLRFFETSVLNFQEQFYQSFYKVCHFFS